MLVIVSKDEFVNLPITVPFSVEMSTYTRGASPRHIVKIVASSREFESILWYRDDDDLDELLKLGHKVLEDLKAGLANGDSGISLIDYP